MSVLLGFGAGCSFVLELDECEMDEHCPNAGDVCVAGSCEPTGSNIDVTEAITGNTEWTSDVTYTLKDTIYVEEGAVLTIRSGTKILGDEGTALIVRPGAELLVRGTQTNPVVFTSSKPEGERLSGDWGGVALLGRAPVNAQSPVLEGLLEVEKAGYGGSDEGYSCGALEYMRIEFAGNALRQDEELNGLTLAGCGSGTLVNHVQVHFGLDDGVEVFGGTVNLRNVVITRAQDDSLDWDQGWQGKAQFIAIQQDSEGDNGIEGDNSSDDNDALPRTSPQVWNLTMFGSGTTGSQRGMTLKEGTAGLINNVLMMGHPIEAIDIKDAATVAQLTAGDLAVRGALLFDIGEDGVHFFPTAEEESDAVEGEERDDDEGFDEEEFFTSEPTFLLGVDPVLRDAFDLTDPGWVPQDTPANMAGIDPPSALFDGFDEQADYAGAFQPGSMPWTIGWTAYPRN